GNTLGPALFQWPPQSTEIQSVWDEIQAMQTSARDVAFAGQKLLEEILLGLARRALRITGSTHLCIGGGVALNCIANGRIARESGARGVFVPPAPGDDGQALGKLMDHLKLRAPELNLALETAYLGPMPTNDEMNAALAARDVRLPVVAENDLCEAVA